MNIIKGATSVERNAVAVSSDSATHPTESPVGPQKARQFFKYKTPGRTDVEFPEQGSWHLERKKQIEKKHPEIKRLFGNDPKTFLYMAGLFSWHMFMAYTVKDASWPVWFLAVYLMGSWNAFQLQALAHEAVHGLIFKEPVYNKLAAIAAFLPIFQCPFGSIWGVEHLWHHNIVVDKCLRFGVMSNNILVKGIFAFATISVANAALIVISKLVLLKIAYTFVLYLMGRSKDAFPKSFPGPVFAELPQIMSGWFVLNELLSIAFNVAVIYYWGWGAFAYLWWSNGFGNGLHPLGMRNVQEHYVFVPNQPTYSLYMSSPLEWLVGFNINYHVEHHDFSRIPWSRLPEVRKIAPEFYNLPHYTSYSEVFWRFFTDKGVPLESFFEGTLGLTLKAPKKSN